MSVVPSQAESRPTTPHQEQLNQTEGANRTGADPQPQARVPVDNVNTFVKVVQSCAFGKALVTQTSTSPVHLPPMC